MDGIIIINKEKEYTSHDVVAIVKKELQEKVGHTGTLDPNATGVLPLLIGKGTKLSKYLINHDKTYEAVIKLGIKTDTGDIWGNQIETKEVTQVQKLDQKEIQGILDSFIGKQEQMPPMYSAIKVNGKKLYEYARNNQTVIIEPRNIEIYDIKLTKCNLEDLEITIQAECSKGTYIRTLCEDIANGLGTIGCMKELNRLKVGEFWVSQAISIQQVKENRQNEEFWKKHLISFEEILKENPEITLDNKQLELFLNGVKIGKETSDGVVRIYNIKNELIGTGTVLDQKLKRDIII